VGEPLAALGAALSSCSQQSGKSERCAYLDHEVSPRIKRIRLVPAEEAGVLRIEQVPELQIYRKGGPPDGYCGAGTEPRQRVSIRGEILRIQSGLASVSLSAN
jgi:hypothetical protein